ncbi:hypothetical protein FV218_01510 [Methylobacterium sp. WL69]|uniref:hypothetical protein n=1 Tax=Methylobacterium sp. WL69 TaxID=2603893 RepID=UPI0011C8E38E|nr:hypothetical protein [Methylobacterium sp. WL69]TXM79155.1 hypothetical protein FV218_01510 [Methylobacterium sp. WL69]
MLFRFLTTGLLGLVVLAPAARAEPAATCQDGPDFTQPTHLATVIAPERVPFVKSTWQDKACPSAKAVCREAAYLVMGNRVLVNGTLRDFACATYRGAKGATRSGWIPQAALKTEPPTNPGLADWVGTWTSGPEQTITIVAKGDSLVLVGEATYGAQNPERVRRGGVNIGQFQATAQPTGANLGFTEAADGGPTQPYGHSDDSACQVRLRLVPPFLQAQSNAGCGGMNVTFTGLYGRKG